MQFYKKTRPGIFGSATKLLIKVILVLFLIFLVIIFLDKINFPSPKKTIEKKIPDENFKIIK
tara:strand:- start:217 stop:402 length:186 start_codon:yes stop_codon:yes gene_type:complete